MKIFYTPKFKEGFGKLSRPIREKFYKQARHLLRNLRHPSLHAKKYDEPRGIWQARADRQFRFYFIIDGENYILLDIKKHSD